MTTDNTKPTEVDLDKLSADIMNLPCCESKANEEYSDRRSAYKNGHRDARHAATDLVNSARASQAVAAPSDALAMLKYVLPHISSRAVDAERARTGPMADAYINTIARRFIEQAATQPPAGAGADERAMYEHWWHEGAHPFRDISKRKNCQLNEEIAWMVWQAARASQAQQAGDGGADESLCPACQGSGEGMMMEGSGPDAYEVPCACPHCKGSGDLLDAYNGAVELLAAEHKKYMSACGELFHAGYTSPAQQSAGQQAGDTISVPLKLAADVLGALFWRGTANPEGYEHIKQEFAALMRAQPTDARPGQGSAQQEPLCYVTADAMAMIKAGRNSPFSTSGKASGPWSVPIYAAPVRAQQEPVAMVSESEMRDIQSGRMGVPVRGNNWREDQTIGLYAAPVSAQGDERAAVLEQAAKLCDDADKSTHPADLADAIRALAAAPAAQAVEPAGQAAAGPVATVDTPEFQAILAAYVSAHLGLYSRAEREQECGALIAHIDGYVRAKLPAAPDAAQADAKDAARYRWLRDKARTNVGTVPIVVMMDDGGDPVADDIDVHGIRDGAELDAAIDAALSASQSNVGDGGAA